MATQPKEKKTVLPRQVIAWKDWDSIVGGRLNGSITPMKEKTLAPIELSVEDLRDEVVAIVKMTFAKDPFETVHGRFGPHPSTLRSWEERKVLRPHLTTLRSALAACGYEITFQPRRQS